MSKSYLTLEIEVAALCGAKPGDNLCDCTHYEADKTDARPCRWLESAKTPAVCGFHAQYLDDAKDYLERVFKAHVAKPEQPVGVNPTKRRVG